VLKPTSEYYITCVEQRPSNQAIQVLPKAASHLMLSREATHKCGGARISLTWSHHRRVARLSLVLLIDEKCIPERRYLLYDIR
jgi:hypothetical protein